MPFIADLTELLAVMAIKSLLQKDIRTDEDNAWESQWLRFARLAKKIVCLLSVDYPESKPCCREFGAAEKMGKSMVVYVHSPEAIEALDVNNFNGAVLFYVMNGGQGILRPADAEAGTNAYEAFLQRAAESIYKAVRGLAWTGGTIARVSRLGRLSLMNSCQ